MRNFNLLKAKTILLGEQEIWELTVLEYKPLFSIKLFHFIKTNGKQDRFHTHAFNAFSFRLWGNYVEEILVDGVLKAVNRNVKRILFIPANQYHRITKSDNCWTLLITGPWGDKFKELRDKKTHWEEYECTHGRKDVGLVASYSELSHVS